MKMITTGRAEGWKRQGKEEQMTPSPVVLWPSPPSDLLLRAGGGSDAHRSLIPTQTLLLQSFNPPSSCSYPLRGVCKVCVRGPSFVRVRPINRRARDHLSAQRRGRQKGREEKDEGDGVRSSAPRCTFVTPARIFAPVLQNNEAFATRLLLEERYTPPPPLEWSTYRHSPS